MDYILRLEDGFSKSPNFFFSELGEAKFKQEEVDNHLEAEAHGRVSYKPCTTLHNYGIHHHQNHHDQHGRCRHHHHMTGPRTTYAILPNSSQEEN